MNFSQFADKWAEFMEAGQFEEQIDEVFKTVSGMKKQLLKADDDYIKSMAADYFERWTSTEAILEDLDVFIDETNDIILGLGNGGFLV